MNKADEPRFCVTGDVIIGQSGIAAAGHATRAALLNAAFWGRGAVLTVSFLEGDPALHRRVAGIASTWSSQTGANIAFDFWIANGRDPTEADIRVAFERSKGSWSMLGRYGMKIRGAAAKNNCDFVAPSVVIIGTVKRPMQIADEMY